MRLYVSTDVEKSHKLHGKVEFQGLPISVENRAGSERHWHDPHSGESGSTKMKYPYGYIRGTLGTDGDEVDVFVGPAKDSTKVFVVTQMKKPNFDEVDEQKVMLGFHSASDAKAAYLDHYDDPKFFGSMKEFHMADFKEKLTSHKGKLIKHLFLADPSAKLEKALTRRTELEAMADEIDKAHIGFDKLQSKIEGQGHSSESAAKIAAAVGNKKYGEKKMHHAAEEGKPLKESQKMDKSCEHNQDGAACDKCNGTHSTMDILKGLNSRLLSMVKKTKESLAPTPDPVAQSGETRLFGPQVAQASFVARAFEAPVATSVAIPTPPQTSPYSPDFMTECGGCGYVHKSLSNCPRCAQVAQLNERTATPIWRR